MGNFQAISRRAIVRWLGAILILMLTGVPLFAQKDLTRIPDPDPEIERRSFQVADGFEVNLFAADPLLDKPSQINFDPAGRLWVACSEVYPQIKPGQKANDKIVVLEDTKGTGKADKCTVFADGLLMPMGVAPGDGGAYVTAGTELLHLADTDGDGKADRQRVVLSGFGTEDTHHIIHTLRWGPDGLLYFNQSVYIHSHVETPHGVRRLRASGVWQLRPETMELEVYLRGLWNPWGHEFDRWGQSFLTDGAGGQGINYGLAGASFEVADGATRFLPGLNPGSPKYCGEAILSGRHLPEEWRGNILTNDFRGNRVCRFVLTEDGAGYAAQEKAELIKTNHSAFRPVDIKMGPDGAIYIADWYNPIIQHGEVDFRDPRRDHVHGRIWRVTAKGRPLVKPPQLVGASTETLLDALKAPEDWTRQQARRVLKERGASVVPALGAWVKGLDPADPEHEHHLLEALWTYQSLDVAEPALLATLLHARDYHARAAATRVTGSWHERLSNPLELLAGRVADDHPRVRLEAVRALARIPTPHAAEVALMALDRPMDRFLDYALWLSARELEPSWMPAFQKGQLDFGGSVPHLVFALQAVRSSAAVPPLVELVRTGKVTGEREESVLALLAALGGPQELALVFDRVMSADAQPARQTRLLAALELTARQRKVHPSGDLQRLGGLLANQNDAVRAGAVRLAGLWHIAGLRPQLVESARAAGTGEPLRQAAIDGLVSIGGQESRNVLDELSGGDRPLLVKRMAIIALASLDLQAAARRAVDLLTIEQDEAGLTAVCSTFLQRKNGAEALTAALAERKLPADSAKIGVRTVRMSGREAPALVEAFTRAGSLTNMQRTLGPKEMLEMVAEVQKQGDPVRGEAIFRRKDQSCLKCHAIAGAGGQVGPDLASIGASAPVDYLVDSILLPNKAVKEGYHSQVVTTSQGRFITGIKVRESKAELVLRDAEDHEIVIPTRDIEDQAAGGSLMPEGLADTLTHAELVDLVRFLSDLGKVGPYAVSKARLVRSWQVLEPTPQAINLLVRTRLGSAASSADPAFTWGPAYTQVSGILPLDALPRLQPGKEAKPVGFVRCRLEASTAGKVKLLLSSSAGLTLWLDGVPVEATDQLVLDLAQGTHVLTFAVDLTGRREGLRCELDDLPGSAARVRIVGGK